MKGLVPVDRVNRAVLVARDNSVDPADSDDRREWDDLEQVHVRSRC
jgi:hypothetical protein